MRYALITNQQHRIVEYKPLANFTDGIPDDLITKNDDEVSQIMRAGEAHLIAGEIVYPPKAGMRYQNGTWLYPSDWINQQKDHLLSRLLRLCDEKQQDIDTFLLKEKNTDGQRKRYQRKYQRALNGEFSHDENTKIINAHEAYLAAYDQQTDMIELARKTITKQIENGNFGQVEHLLKNLANTTIS